jgi:carbamoyltransferase
LLKHDYSSLDNLTEQEQFDFAARLQQLTEEVVYDLMKPYIDEYDVDSICLSGGVALNCVMTGKMKVWFDKIKNIYIPAVPYDAGLAIGCVQYLYHQLMENSIDENDLQNSPYLGIPYSIDDVKNTIEKYSEQVQFGESSYKEICELLQNENIISLFNGKSESGRRALGNRSIIADPRNNNIREVVNHKTKHRQWFRPFAPSILEDKTSEWFVDNVFSPYMSFAIQFKEDKKQLVPAVVHKDGTGRLQTVSKKLNPNYYELISEWERQTGVPIVLNTSFNDKEPIVETPEDAIKCFLKTKIDYLYFVEYNLLITKK